jgi:hypothetical protein
VNDDLLRVIGNTVLGTVCTVIVVGFLLVTVYALAHFAVKVLDHVDHEIRKTQTAGSAAQASWARWPAPRENVTDVPPESRRAAQLQLVFPDGPVGSWARPA